MRLIILTLLSLSLITISCKKDNDTVGIPDGTYAGTFQRITDTSARTSNVTLTFSENTWTGQSQFIQYPALCNGTYHIKSGNTATFVNRCAWTANFDWTLILSQDYKVERAGESLEISKDYTNGAKDIYKLMKQ